MTELPPRRRRYPLVLGVVFLLYAGAWAYRPVDVKDWALENAIAAVFVLALVVSYRRFPLSNVSYTLIFVFLCLHTIGAHYTYSLVPYDVWAKKLTGTTINEIFGFERAGVTDAGKVQGRFRATGAAPKLLDRLRVSGIQLAANIFEENVPVNL